MNSTAPVTYLPNARYYFRQLHTNIHLRTNILAQDHELLKQTYHALPRNTGEHGTSSDLARDLCQAALVPTSEEPVTEADAILSALRGKLGWLERLLVGSRAGQRIARLIDEQLMECERMLEKMKELLTKLWGAVREMHCAS